MAYYDEAQEKLAYNQLTGSIGSASIRPATLQEEMQHQLDRAKAEVARLTELTQLLGQHPEIHRILELMGRKY